jgi:hypothetical protein
MYYLIGVSEMAKHNATGRTQSKAQRQAAMNPRTNPTLPTPATAAALTSPPLVSSNPEDARAIITGLPAVIPQPEAPATAVVPFTGKGAAMRTRWSAVLKSRPGAKLVMPADIKSVPRDSLITALVPGNPKKQNAAKRYEKYGFNMVKGATTTVGRYVEAVAKLGKDRSASWATEGVALADIAWDINHGFIEVTIQAAASQPEQEQPVMQVPVAEVPIPENVDVSTPLTVAELPDLEITSEEITQETIDAEPIDPTEDAEVEAPRPTDAWATVNEAPAEDSTESEAA